MPPLPPLRLAFLGDPNSVHVRRWISFLAARDHEVHLLVADHLPINPGLDPRIAIDQYSRFGSRHLRIASSLQGRSALRALLASIDPMVVHAHYLSTYGWQARLADVHPYIITIWGSDLLVDLRRSARARWWARRTLEAADLITVATDQLAAAAAAAGADPGRVVKVRFGVDTERYAPGPVDTDLRDRLGVGARKVVFSPRSIRPLYRHETIALAFAQLEQDAVLLMSGRNADPEYLSGIRRLVREHGVAERVIVVDDIADTDMPGMYRLADIVVSVPDSDGLPLTVLEAMATGRPFVASDLAGLRELLGTEFPGMLVTPGDAPALGWALEGMLALPRDRLEEMARRLRERVMAIGDHTTNMLAMEKYYRQLSQGAVHRGRASSAESG